MLTLPNDSKIFRMICSGRENVEIMGEAINRILKHDPDFSLPNSRAIIATRNRVIHGYDSVTTEFIWSLIIRHIPALKKVVEALLSDNK